MHTDQIDIDVDTAQALIHDQFPDWRGLELRGLPDAGSDHTIFRIGDRLTARFPRQSPDPDDAQPDGAQQVVVEHEADQAAAHQVAVRLQAEQAAGHRIAECCPVPVPEVVAIGAPGPGFPLPWSVQSWVPGQPVTSTSHGASTPFADDLVALIVGLRDGDTRGETFAGSGRGGRVADHDDWVAECLHQSHDLFDTGLLRELWQGYRELPDSGPDVMSHTDLIPGNVVTDGKRLVGVLDVGGFQATDPALDLVGAWHLLDADRRARVRTALASTDTEWARGRAWAFEQAIGAVWYYLDSNPALAQLVWTLYRIVEAETGDARRLAPESSRIWAWLRQRP